MARPDAVANQSRRARSTY